MHEVVSAIDPGVRPPRIEDAFATFTVSAPTEEWDIPVLAVADSAGGRSRGGLATSLATDTLIDALGGRMLRLDLTTAAWQSSLAEVVDGAFAAASRRVAVAADEGPGPATAMLTAALLVGDWLAVAHVGTSRVYRMHRDVLEQLTVDGARGRLGEPAAETPAMHLTRVRPGDLVLVCSDGLHRYVDGPELAGHLAARRPLGDIASTLVALARARGGEDNIALCLARIGRLSSDALPDPEPLPLRLADQVGNALLPRHVLKGSRWWQRAPARALGVAAGLAALALIGVAAMRDLRDEGPMAIAALERVARETLATRESGEALARGPAVEAPPRDVITAPPAAEVPLDTPAAAPPPADTPAAAVERAAAPAETPARSIADSIAEARREAARLAPIRERARRDSIAKAEAARVVEEERVADSIAAVQLAALEAERELRVRDSIAAAERAEREAAAARAREAEATRAREDSARAESERRTRAREQFVTAGRRRLEGWYAALEGAIAAGNAEAGVLQQGPPRFAEFVAKRRPAVSGGRITQISVNEATGTANAELTLRWKSEFGTANTRRMRVSATIAPAGDGWTLRGWQILDGAP